MYWVKYIMYSSPVFPTPTSLWVSERSFSSARPETKRCAVFSFCTQLAAWQVQVAKNGWHSLWTWPAWFWFNHQKWGCNTGKMVLLCAVPGMYGFVQNGLMDWIRYTRNMWPWIMGKIWSSTPRRKLEAAYFWPARLEIYRKGLALAISPRCIF